jgi:hypothetical protein
MAQGGTQGRQGPTSPLAVATHVSAKPQAPSKATATASVAVASTSNVAKTIAAKPAARPAPVSPSTAEPRRAPMSTLGRTTEAAAVAPPAPVAPRVQRANPPPLPPPAPSPSSDAASSAIKDSSSPAPEAPPDVRPIVRTLVEQAIAPLEGKLREMERRAEDLQRRVDLLERRPAPAIPAAAVSAAAVIAPASAAVPYRPTVAGATQTPSEGSLRLDPELKALDGRRRRARLILTVFVLLGVTFAVLFAALAESYTHAHP